MKTEKRPHRPAHSPTHGVTPVAAWWDVSATACRLCGSKEVGQAVRPDGWTQVTFEPTLSAECQEAAEDDVDRPS